MNKIELVSTLNGMVLFFYVCNIVGLEARLEEPLSSGATAIFTSYADC